jgi:single-stranded-DNA-specific exonuclease
MSARWRLKPFDQARVAAFSREAGVSLLLAQILLNRAINDPAAAQAFLKAHLKSLHDPELLPGAAEAADRLVRAIRESRKIVIYGDYDVDGVCGTSILWACLRLAGAKDVDYYIPHRVDEGYGVNPQALRRIASETKADVVVTVDCGISAVAEAKLARELGLELIVTDHHTPGPTLPDASVIVHPRLGSSPYPYPELCGAAVAFKVAWQVCKSFGDGKRASPHLRDFLVRSIGLVALATIADVVPITGENRILVRHGLAGIEADPTEGLRALIEVAGAMGKKRLTSGTVAFGLAPRINAAGRMEQAMQAVAMLTTDDTAIARSLASELDRCNTLRQEVEQTIVAEAKAMVEQAGGISGRGAIVVAKEGWHAGVIGIVASRLAELYHRPAIVVALNDGLGQGSARSVPGFNLHDAISACSEGLTGFGGHAAAAGLKLPSALVPSFAERFDRHCREMLTSEQLERVLHIDAEVLLGHLTLRQVEEIDALEPYGIGNPRPMLVVNRVRLKSDPRIVGARQNHAQLLVTQGSVTLKAVAWQMAERCKGLRAGMSVTLAFQPSINEWNGRREVQLEIKDFKVDAEETTDHARPDAPP